MSRRPRCANTRSAPARSIRRIQAEPVDHVGPQSGLLETGAALSRRDRIPDHQRCIDAAPFLHRRQGGRLFRGHDAAIEGREDTVPQAICDTTTECQPQPARQPGRAALQQCRVASGDVADPRPPGIYRHHRRRAGTIGGVMQPPPEGVWGMPAYALQNAAGIRSGRRSSRASPQDHGEAGLRPQQAAAVTVATRNVQPTAIPR